MNKQECEKAYEIVELVFQKTFNSMECEPHELPPFEDFVSSMGILENLVKEHFELVKAIQFIFGISAVELIKEYREKNIKEVKS